MPGNESGQASVARPQWTAEPSSCFYCGCDLERLKGPVTPTSAVRDHVLPRVRGGTSDESNLVWCCWECNSSKHKRLFPFEWVPDVGRNTILVVKERFEVGVKPWHLGLAAVGVLVWLEEAWTEPVNVDHVASTIGAGPGTTRSAVNRLLTEGWFTFEATSGWPYQRWLTVRNAELPKRHDQ